MPVVTLSASATSICAGAISTLTVTGANTYTWSPATSLSATAGSSVTANPTSTITYTVIGTNAFGCTDNKSSIITVNALPVVTAIASLTTVCKDAFVNLTGGGASSYTWSGGVTNGVSFAPTATQTYTVTGTNANGCVNTSDIEIIVDLCTGIESIQNNTISIFPNPTNGLINIIAESKIEAIEITNLVGEKIYSSTLNLDAFTIDLREQAVGVYYINVKTEQGVINKKIILNK